MGGPAGFYGAPVSKLFLGIVGAGCLLSNIFKWPTYVNLTDITSQGQIWRLLLSAFTFGSPPEALLGLYFLYQFRQFERHMGSRKFAAFLFLTSLIGKTAQLAAMSMFARSVPKIVTGPYEIIFAMFVHFHLAVPKVQPRYMSVFGLNFSDKTLTYLLGMQLACNDGRHSILPAASGICAGLMYQSDILPLNGWQMPQSISSLCRRTIMPLIASEAPGAAARRAAAQRARRERRDAEAAQAQLAAMMRGMQMPGGAPGTAPAAPTAPVPSPWAQPTAMDPAQFTPAVPTPAPSEELVDSIVSMGFERERVLVALSQTQNNRQMAIHRLLS